MRDTSATAVRQMLEGVGLDGDIAQYNEMQGLSGGQKVKVVIAASMFNRYSARRDSERFILTLTGHNVCSLTSLPTFWTERPLVD